MKRALHLYMNVCLCNKELLDIHTKCLIGRTDTVNLKAIMSLPQLLSLLFASALFLPLKVVLSYNKVVPLL